MAVGLQFIRLPLRRSEPQRLQTCLQQQQHLPTSMVRLGVSATRASPDSLSRVVADLPLLPPHRCLLPLPRRLLPAHLPPSVRSAAATTSR